MSTVTQTYFRSAPARGIQTGQGVDRARNTIFGVSVVTIGVVPSHDAEIDRTTLDMLAELGNTSPTGIKSRYTHPAWQDGLGSLLGRLHSFRIDGDRLRGDLRLSPAASTSPRGDLGSYILDLAESDPDAFGLSISIPQDDLVYVEGHEYRVARPTRFTAADCVDTPAANSGLFSTPNRKAIPMKAPQKLYSEALRLQQEFRDGGGESVAGVCEDQYVKSGLRSILFGGRTVITSEDLARVRRPETKPSTTESAFRAEYRSARWQDVHGVSEEQYVASCMATEAGGVVARV